MSEKIVVRCPECDSQIRIPKGKHVEFTCNNCHKELRFDDRSIYTKIDESEEKKAISWAVIYLLALLIAFPLVIILNQYIPVDEDFTSIWKIASLIAITSVLGIIFRRFQNFILISLGCLLLFLGIGTLSDKYGFSDLLFDYKSVTNSLSRSPELAEISVSRLRPFQRSEEILQAIDYNDPVVRNFAHNAIENSNFDAGKYFKYRTIIQSFAIFKEVKQRWYYVSDPVGEEYFATASETINNAANGKSLMGDCDDYSILLAACIKAIGGKVRLVRTTGHIYPEILIDSRQDLEDIDYIISNDLFPNAVDRKNLYFHVDGEDRIWLNLDYTAHYPGGRFLNPNVTGTLDL